MTIDQVFTNVVQVVSYLVLAGSALSAASPGPILDVDASSAPSWQKKILGSKIYIAYYKLLKVCALNVGWARNFADPKQIRKIAAVISALSTAASVSESTDSGTAAPKIDAVKMNGDISVTR